MAKINIWRILGLLCLVIFAILFFNVLVYIAGALVLFLLGTPISTKLQRLRFRRWHVPATVASLVTLLIMCSVAAAINMLIFPPLIAQLHELTGLNLYEAVHNILLQFPGLKKLILKFGSEEELKQNLSAQLYQLINASNAVTVINHIFQYTGTLVTAVVCILFITFFLLRDERLVKEVILTLTPEGYESTAAAIMLKSKKMLSRYFTGLFIDMLSVGILVFAGLSFSGSPNALLIACMAGLLNIVPYIGPLITLVIALAFAAGSCISLGAYDAMLPVMSQTFFTLVAVNLVDGLILQPLIFSNTVRAHPLEIFIVTLMAGTLAGIPGMIVALPVYTLFRITGGLLFAHLKLFRKISARL
jgi:predicted PurR-regulated permease PerM